MRLAGTAAWASTIPGCSITTVNATATRHPTADVTLWGSARSRGAVIDGGSHFEDMLQLAELLALLGSVVGEDTFAVLVTSLGFPWMK